MVSSGQVQHIAIVGPRRIGLIKQAWEEQKAIKEVMVFLQSHQVSTAHAVKISRDFLGDDRFVMFLGVNTIEGAISGLIGEFESREYNCQIVLTAVDNPSQYGVAELDPETRSIVRLVEKPRNPPSNLILVGIYMFNEHVWEAVNAIKPSWRGELEITDAIQYLVDKGYNVHPYVHRGWWIDTGEPDEMLL